MSVHLIRDLDALRQAIMDIAGMVEQAINQALVALLDRRIEVAETVIDDDEKINRKEVQIEDQCLKILALHQPVAADLRFIVTAIKVNNDLERMGDLAANIAERAVYLAIHDALPVQLDFKGMAAKVRAMVHRSLDALATGDVTLAREVLAMDDRVDAMNREMFIHLQRVMYRDPETIESAQHLLSVSRHLERMGDLATNIAQDVVYMVQGEIIRHNNAQRPIVNADIRSNRR